MKNIVIGSDHTGVELKSFFKNYLKECGYDIIDVGVDNADACDYPDVAKSVAEHIKKNPSDMGILICGTGLGMSIAVNRFPFIRGAVLYSTEVAKLAREHNDANVAIFGARTFSEKENLNFLKVFLSSKFSKEERHIRRIAKLS